MLARLLVLALVCCSAFAYTTENMTPEQVAIAAKGKRTDKNGWIYLEIGGSAYERGFQQGSMIAIEYQDALAAFKYFTLFTTGKTYDFFSNKAVELHKKLIYKELLDEVRGIAEGISSQGFNATVDDIIGWNAYQEMTGYWWPVARDQYANNKMSTGHYAKSHCSAFIATGSATLNGEIVIGHQTFTEFWNGQFWNVIVHLKPESSQGFEVLWQGGPGWVGSGTDFWINSAEIMVVETTIVGYQGYNSSALPEWVRVRKATQYADSIDSWVAIMESQNNGGYANSWLIGDGKVNEIAELELGLVYQSYNKKSSGYFFGDNAPNDPRIRNLECTDVGYNDVRQQTGARRTRWPQLLEEHYGKITATVGQKMLGDTFDPYLKKENPSSRTICAHYDIDPQYYVSDPNAVWNVPFTPAGSTEGKITTANLAKNMSMWGIFGRADGVAFDAPKFLKENPQWGWQSPYLRSRPAQPWTLFSGK